MNTPSPPLIHSQSSGMMVRFQPRKQWGFASLERFELKTDGLVPADRLRHTYSTLNDFKATISYRDLERMLRERLRGSEFQEVSIESVPIEESQGPAPLICWGIYQPPERRPQAFYLEGGFHQLPRGVRFEFYAGVMMGLGSVTASTLASELLRVAQIPVQPAHPTVVNLDPLTEVSLALCLDWGWKLPKRRGEASVVVGEHQVSFITGVSHDRYRARNAHDGALDRVGVTPEHRAHLNALRSLHEGERLVQRGELESAKIFYQSHAEHPRGALRYAETSLHLPKANRDELSRWIKDSPLEARERLRMDALIAESDLQFKRAADQWERFIEVERSEPSSRGGQETSRASDILIGLAHITRGLLLREVDLVASLAALESARAFTPRSAVLLQLCAQVALQLDDRFLAQARLTEMAQRFISDERTGEAAQVWSALGDLWMSSAETWGSAERAYLRAIEIDPDSSAFHCQLSELYIKRGQRSAARELLVSFTQKHPYAKDVTALLEKIQKLPLTSLRHGPGEPRRESARSIAPTPPIKTPGAASHQSLAHLVTIIPRDSSDDIPALVEGDILEPEASISEARSPAQLWSDPPLKAPQSEAHVDTRDSRELIERVEREGTPPLVSAPPVALDAPEMSGAEMAEPEMSEADVESPRRRGAELNGEVMSARERVTSLESQLRSLEASSPDAASPQDRQHRAQICLELAYTYRDQLLDLESARTWLWRGLESVDEGVESDAISRELGEALTELYASSRDLQGLSRYYSFLAARSHRDAVGAYLQRAAISRELGSLDLDHIELALDDCAMGMSAYQELSSQERRSLQATHERLVKLRASLLQESGREEEAGDLLLTELDSLDGATQLSRKQSAARAYADVRPSKTHELYRELYSVTPTPELLERWLSHVNHWGDAHSRAEVVRLYAETLLSEGGVDAVLTRRAARCLYTLADEVKPKAPLLALELYFEALDRSSDPEVAERAVELADRHQQYQALSHALSTLISECLPGEYRGHLKLKRAFSLAAAHDPDALSAFMEALSELVPIRGELEDHDELDELLSWAKSRCAPDVYRRYYDQLVLSEIAEARAELKAELNRDEMSRDEA